MDRADDTRGKHETGSASRRLGKAVLRVGPSGGAATNPRRYRVLLEVTPDVARTEEIADARALGIKLLEDSFAASSSRPSVTRDVWSTDTAHRGRAAASALAAVEVELECLGWPAESTARLQLLLQENGYRVVSDERRACAEEGCRSEALIVANRRGRVEDGWYSESLCGKHNYRTCPGCRSVFRLMSTSAMGPAPSVACTMCGLVLVEWGGSKHWEIELVASGTASS